MTEIDSRIDSRIDSHDACGFQRLGEFGQRRRIAASYLPWRIGTGIEFYTSEVDQIFQDPYWWREGMEVPRRFLIIYSLAGAMGHQAGKSGVTLKDFLDEQADRIRDSAASVGYGWSRRGP